LNADDMKALFASAPLYRELKAEIRLLERTRAAVEGSEWSPFRESKRIVLLDAGIKVESISTNKGDAVNVTLAGTPEPTLESWALGGGRPS
jgi:hypothetical protein